MGFFSRKRDILAVLSRMEWGAATPEFSNEQLGALVHVFNHDLQTASNVERALRFAAGRIKWYTVYLRNAFPHHRIIFDDEGADCRRKYAGIHSTKSETLCGYSHFHFGGGSVWLIILGRIPPQKLIGNS